MTDLRVTNQIEVDPQNIREQLRTEFEQIHELPLYVSPYNCSKEQRKAFLKVFGQQTTGITADNVSSFEEDNAITLADIISPNFSEWLTEVTMSDISNPLDVTVDSYLYSFQEEFKYLDPAIVFRPWIDGILKPWIMHEVKEISDCQNLGKVELLIKKIMYITQHYDNDIRSTKSPFKNYFSGLLGTKTGENTTREAFFNEILKTFAQQGNTMAMSLFIAHWLSVIKEDRRHTDDNYVIFNLNYEHDMCSQSLVKLAELCAEQQVKA